MDLIAKLAFLLISLMWSLKDKVLSITMPKFLTFALIPIVLFANIKVPNGGGKMQYISFTRIALQHVLSFPCKNVIYACLKNFDRNNRMVRVFKSDVNLGIDSVEHAV